MGGLFVNDGSGYVHDCDEPGRPTESASFTCPECETEWYAINVDEKDKWIWVHAQTGKPKH